MSFTFLERHQVRQEKAHLDELLLNSATTVSILKQEHSHRMANRRSRIRVVKRLNQYLKSMAGAWLLHGVQKSVEWRSLTELFINQTRIKRLPSYCRYCFCPLHVPCLTTILLIRQAPSQALFDISPGLVEQTINSETKIEVLEMIYLASIGLSP